ncbi:hypothetical protein N9051_01755 [Akkermansiaceae bacterium]|nr:hypothetical protein [Akkermansiaceae bacterium]
MAEDHNNNDSSLQAHSTSHPTPASNQNLIIGIILGAAVLLFLVLMIITQVGNDSSKSESYELSELKNKIEAAQRANAAERARRGFSTDQAAEALNSKIKQDVDALTNLLASQQAALAELSDSKATVRSLNRQNTELQNQLAQARMAAQRVAGLEQQVATLRADLDMANKRLASAVDQTTVDTLRQ